MKTSSSKNPPFERWTQKSKKILTLKRIRALFSILIIYHLAAIFLGPNTESYVGEKLKPYFMKYWSALEFGSQWNFFAPEPGPAPIFIKYELYDKDGLLMLADQIPAYPDDYFFRDRQIRRLNIVRFLMRDDQKIYSVFVPWLCREFPEAESVSVRTVSYKLPTVSEIQKQERKFDDDTGAITHKLSTVTCEGRRS